MRRGPNVVGPFGLLQPFADAIKMLMKETIIPSGASRKLFIAAPMLTFTLAMLAWAVIPVNDGWAIADINVGCSTCCDLLARRLWHHHRRLGLELEIRLPRLTAGGGADGEL
jgi:NADH:ubiquinone oxidoreductase subunit H